MEVAMEVLQQKALFEFMDVYNNKNLSGGVWQQTLQDAVEVYNKINHTSFDPYQSFIDYIKSEFPWGK